MVSVCLPSDALLQHLPSYLGFSYFERGVSLYGCSSKAQPLLLTLDEGYLLTSAPPDLEHGVAPLGPHAPAQPPLLRRVVAPLGCRPWPWAWGSSSWPPPVASGMGYLLLAAPSLSQPGTLGCRPDLRRGVAPLGHACVPSQPPVLVRPRSCPSLVFTKYSPLTSYKANPFT